MSTSKIRPLLDGNGEITYPLTCSDALMNRDGNPVGEINDIFDISEYNATGDPSVFAKYDTLSLALADVPSSKQKGGMTIRYIQNSDNKYIQARCMAQNFSTNESDWQAVDEEPTVGSRNLVQSLGVDAFTSCLNNIVSNAEYQFQDGYFYSVVRNEELADSSFSMCKLSVFEGQKLVITGNKYTTGATNLYIIFPSDGSETIYSDINSADALLYTVPKTGLMYVNVYKSQPHSVKPYSSLISGIQGNIESIQEHVSVLNKMLPFYKIKDLFKNYGYIASDGTTHPELTVFKYTDLITIVERSAITTYGYSTSQACSIIAFYDKNKDFISTINQTVTTAGITIPLSDVPTNAKYIRSTALFESVSDDSCIFMGTMYDIARHIIDNADLISDIAGSGLFTNKGYIIPADGTFQPNESFRATNYIPIDGNACQIVLKYYTTSGGTAQVAFYDRNKTHISSISGTNLLFEGRVINTSDIPANAKYIKCSAQTASLNNRSIVLATSMNQLVYKLTEASEFINPYANKTCLYIGDSISTSNLYYWKGYVENLYALSYARDIENQLWPANGGISLCPPQTESESLSEKSIWYRCAENRMSIYDFDVISLFGGTNDMWGDGYEGVVLGTTDDIPYVDDASSFANPSNYTDVWANNLTFAQCMMGCIEMLQRDFPSKEIIICSVMPCGGNYGNQLDANNVRMSERMAILQGLIAKKYNLKFIPFYWDMRNVLNVNVFSIDGCHPNDYQARRMCEVMKTSLFL